ncbi:protein htrL [Elysia marginata]|uniref:Protein htrL n=1 Tax=Elysia marginata TaxID=1093978 RepID=A0AAV4HPV0_9GAST|nr:protein htrL [Elysia marginata]
MVCPRKLESNNRKSAGITNIINSVAKTSSSTTMKFDANLRLQINRWNERPSKKIDHLYSSDPVLKAIHERMLTKSKFMTSEVTLVTAYFNLGKLNKGRKFGIGPGYTPEKYKRWMSVFGRLDNPLVVFTDSHDIADMFYEMRAHFGDERTRIIKMNRTDLYSFSLAPRIKEVFSQPGYPAYDPNTVNENYSCVMHAKFELVAKVIKEELFNTRYVSWLDIGLFRAVVDEQYIFPVRLPHGFDPDKVSYSGQTVFDSSLSPYQIIVEDKAWVGGAMFLGRPEVLYVYTQDYLRAVEKLLDEGMMSTDQQVIYIMYQPIFPVKPRVEIQTYTTFSTDDWFYLGYSIKESWDYHLRKAVSMLKFLQYIL